MPFVELDRRILSRCLKREPGAWEEFVDRFIGMFVHVIRHTGYSRSVELTADDVDDFCSEIFLTLMKNDFAVLRHFKGKSSLATYLAVVSRRIVVKAITQKKRSEAMGHLTVHASALPEHTETGHQTADIDEVRNLLGQIPPAEAALVKMFYIDGLSYQEISSRMNLPENSIGPILHRARERMKALRTPAN